MVKTLALVLSCSVLFAVPASAEDTPAPDSHAKASHGPHWSYVDAGGAENWGDLDPAFETCKMGHHQSPININAFSQADLPVLQVNYQPTPLDVVNNGHTIQANYQPGSSLTVGDKTYNLLQFHFHTPSEHYVDGAPYPMEAHFVHKAEDGTLAVVGAMMKIGKANPTIEGIWLNAPAVMGRKQVESVNLNAKDLLPANLEYYKYEGSLTTPPCSEGVQWHVLKQPIQISEEQLKAFQNLFPVNARPIQTLHQRSIGG